VAKALLPPHLILAHITNKLEGTSPLVL